MDEVRQIKAVDHRPADEQSPNLPSVLNGAFTFGGSYLSPELEPCYDYALRGSRRWEGRTVFVVEYTDEKHKGPMPAACRSLEPLVGRAFVDAESMQVVHVEQSRPEHKLEPGQYDLNPDIWEGTPPGAIAAWNWSVDYAPVAINGSTFWLPKTITSKTESSSARWVRWSFQAEYSNYHLMTVRSVLMPTVSSNLTP